MSSTQKGKIKFTLMMGEEGKNSTTSGEFNGEQRELSTENEWQREERRNRMKINMFFSLNV